MRKRGPLAMMQCCNVDYSLQIQTDTNTPMKVRRGKRRACELACEPVCEGTAATLKSLKECVDANLAYTQKALCGRDLLHVLKEISAEEGNENNRVTLKLYSNCRRGQSEVPGVFKVSVYPYEEGTYTHMRKVYPY